jgi:hypothetical protein
LVLFGENDFCKNQGADCHYKTTNVQIFSLKIHNNLIIHSWLQHLAGVFRINPSAQSIFNELFLLLGFLQLKIKSVV